MVSLSDGSVFVDLFLLLTIIALRIRSGSSNKQCAPRSGATEHDV